jgi:hypothetical protein
MKTKLVIVILLLVSAVPTVFGDPGSSWSNLVVNGSFELPALPSGTNHVVPANEMAPWETTDDAFLIWASELPNELAAEGRQHLAVGSVWQTIATVPGEDYRLSFYHAPRPGVFTSLSVRISLVALHAFAINGAGLTGFKWGRWGMNFTAMADATTISFNTVGTNVYIDDVRLERLPLSSTLRVSEVEFCWPSVATRVYQVQYRSTLTTNLWTNLLQPVQGNGEDRCIKDPMPADEPRRFYRVITGP